MRCNMKEEMLDLEIKPMKPKNMKDVNIEDPIKMDKLMLKKRM